MSHFQPLEVVARCSETQLQVGEKVADMTYAISVITKIRNAAVVTDSDTSLRNLNAGLALKDYFI